MILPFSKMQSLGNDFVLLDGVSQRIQLPHAAAVRLADRHFGVGCDQILLVEPAAGDADFTLRIFNQDGSEVGQCGNGARCLAQFLQQQHLWQAPAVHVRTDSARMRLALHTDATVSADMGPPVFDPAAIPLRVDGAAECYSAPTSLGALTFYAVSMGNPHAVFVVDDVATAPVATLGAELQQHALFPQRVNAGFMAIRSADQIDLRVFERGVGETLGCGSGACAAVVVGIRQGRLTPPVTVNLPGGRVCVSWAGPGASVVLRGPVETVFSGRIAL